MKIRRYKGPNREALYDAIRREMGPHAVVVTPETGSSALFGKNRHELIAIVEDNDSDPPRQHIDSMQRAASPQRESTPASSPSLPADDFKRWRCMQARQWRELQEAITEIRSTMADLQVVRPEAATETPKDSGLKDTPAHARGWDPRLIELAQSYCPDLLSDDPVTVEHVLADWLPIASGFALQHKDEGPHVIALVGPTGSGKTTTLAKLAEIAAGRLNLRVGLITTDTYRIAAVDQIREYASLMDLPLRVAFSDDEARKAVAALSDCDVILVDTPGRAFNDKLGLSSMHKVLKGMGSMSMLLVVPATMASTDLPDVIGAFSGFKPDGLIVTKVDETRCPTLFTALPFETDLRVMFVTNGQRVPQDIFTAAGGPVARLLLTEFDGFPQRGITSTAPRPPIEIAEPEWPPAPRLDAADAAIQECLSMLEETRHLVGEGDHDLDLVDEVAV